MRNPCPERYIADGFAGLEDYLAHPYPSLDISNEETATERIHFGGCDLIVRTPGERSRSKSSTYTLLVQRANALWRGVSKDCLEQLVYASLSSNPITVISHAASGYLLPGLPMDAINKITGSNIYELCDAAEEAHNDELVLDTGTAENYFFDTEEGFTAVYYYILRPGEQGYRNTVASDMYSLFRAIFEEVSWSEDITFRKTWHKAIVMGLRTLNKRYPNASDDMPT